MRITVTIDDDVFQAAKAQARSSGKRLGEALSQIARTGLRASAKTGNVDRLPVFKVPAGAKVIPASRAGEILEDVSTAFGALKPRRKFRSIANETEGMETAIGREVARRAH
jgi:hypothetical protein